MDKFDIGIIGAGIAGCSLAILLAQAGKKVVLFEKQDYPTHRVCGEFISLESFDFFEQLGLPLRDWNLPIIKNLVLTSQKGTQTTSKLEIGGFGLSRYKLDFELVQLAAKSGVKIHLNTKVQRIEKNNIICDSTSAYADLIIGSHGKYTPNYLESTKPKKGKNYIGVKYHIKGNFAGNEIALHSFEGGYCGMSKVEDNTFCLCYLVDSELLKRCDNKIDELEKRYLLKNQALKNIYANATFLWEKPLVISNIKFSKNEVSIGEIIFVGDAAGSISPLSGNGMSIAARSANVLSQLILENSTELELIKSYNRKWDSLFANRVSHAKLLNKIMLNTTTHDFVLKTLNAIPYLKHKVVSAMQGERFVRNG